MRVLTTNELLSACGTALGLGVTTDIDGILRPALRRAVYLLAPCSFAELVRFVIDPLTPFGDIREKVELALEEMITYGDILEMCKLESDPWGVPSYVLRPAPPAFVVRSASEFIIVGVSGDLPSPLPAELASLVRTEGHVRILRGTAEDHLAEHLKILGLAQLSEHAWLRTPAAMSATDYLEKWNARLVATTPFPSTIEGLELLDTHRPSTFYRGRWRTPITTDYGWYVARRTQVYGAKLWSLVEVEGGATQRVLDLVANDGFHRSCDLAWRIQAAFDANSGSPQRVSVERAGTQTYLDFQSPIPSFAERRLALVGAKTNVQGSLFRFEIPEARAASELAALQSILWIQPLHKERMP
jgi:hypothetical protein